MGTHDKMTSETLEKLKEREKERRKVKGGKEKVYIMTVMMLIGLLALGTASTFSKEKSNDYSKEKNVEEYEEEDDDENESEKGDDEDDFEDEDYDYDDWKETYFGEEIWLG